MYNEYLKQYIFEDYEALSTAAAQFAADCINSVKKPVLGLPTGGTPIGMYKCLRRMYSAGKTDFENCITFNLDEYIGLAPTDKRSYRFFMEENLFKSVNLKNSSVHFLNGSAHDLGQECARYDRELFENGPINLQILGMGANGHIGFNEPDVFFVPETHIRRLSASTIASNARFFSSDEEVPRRALTMGIAPIMRAEKILLLVCGEEKCALLEKALNGNVTPELPVSVLLLHKNTTVMKCRQEPEKKL